MEISIPHGITYTTKGDVPVSIVAASLLANEYLILQSVKILEDCYPGLEVKSTSIKVNSVSNASPLKELLVVALVVSYQKDLEREIPSLIEWLTGHSVSNDMTRTVTVLVLIAAIYVIDRLSKRLFPGKETKELQKEYERKIREVSYLSGIDKDALNSLIERRYKEDQPKILANHVMAFFRPAKIDRGAGIEVDGLSVISPDVIAEIPDAIDYELLEKQRSYEIKNCEIEIHRTDRDQNKHGWRARIKAVGDKITRMELSPEISPTELYGKFYAVGDVIVVEEMDDAGKYATRAYHLTKLRSSD